MFALGVWLRAFFLSALDNLYIQEESVMEKKYDFQKAEKALEKMWQENEIYRYQNGKERKIFSIDTPPPTVSGKSCIFLYTGRDDCAF